MTTSALPLCSFTQDQGLGACELPAARKSRAELAEQRPAGGAAPGIARLARHTCVCVLPTLGAILYHRAARGSHHLGAGALVALVPPVVPRQVLRVVRTHVRLLRHGCCCQAAAAASCCSRLCLCSIVANCCQGSVPQRVCHPGDGIGGRARKSQVQLQEQERVLIEMASGGSKRRCGAGCHRRTAAVQT